MVQFRAWEEGLRLAAAFLEASGVKITIGFGGVHDLQGGLKLAKVLGTPRMIYRVMEGRDESESQQIPGVRHTRTVLRRGLHLSMKTDIFYHLSAQRRD